MGHALEHTTLSIEDFLVWDTTQAERSELVDGVIYAMSGAEDTHVTVAGNVYIALREHLRGTPCRAYTSDMKLRVQAANSIFHPDGMVTCSPADQENKLVKQEPSLLVEVLSPSTAACDRGEKFVRYRLLPSLREYMLIDVDSRRTDVYRKGADGLWVLHPFGPGEAVHLASVDLNLPAERLFEELER